MSSLRPLGESDSTDSSWTTSVCAGARNTLSRSRTCKVWPSAFAALKIRVAFATRFSRIAAFFLLALFFIVLHLRWCWSRHPVGESITSGCPIILPILFVPEKLGGVEQANVFSPGKHLNVGFR